MDEKYHDIPEQAFCCKITEVLLDEAIEKEFQNNLKQNEILDVLEEAAGKDYLYVSVS